uniref:ATP-dependent RNA helicase n=1 Tax=Cyprinus carpio TaxID=7962 RepID=A0A8C1L5W7_CYPCA
RVQKTTKKRDWVVERENIQKLVKKYSEISPKEAVKFSDFPLSKKTLKVFLWKSQYIFVILDEADRILDMGFTDTLNAIVENLPKTRQTLLFSATQTRSVRDLARLSLKYPEYVWVHETMLCVRHQKVNMFFLFMRSHLKKKIIVFFASCKEVQYLFRVFCQLRPGISVLALHCKQQQMKRMEVYNDFVRKTSAILFATDIAARGLDFPAVNWVLQFDCPKDANTYIHRVGRTARYKEGGEALLVLYPSEEKGMIAQLQEIKVPINQIKVNPEKLEAFLAQEKEQKEQAQRCFVSYLRSDYLMKNKDVFDVFQLELPEYATRVDAMKSLGLVVAPQVHFLNKAQQEKSGVAQDDSGAAGNMSKDELKSFKAQLKGEQSKSQSSQSEEEEEEDDDEEESLKPAALICDVFNINKESQDDGVNKQHTSGESKFTDAKKMQKRNFKVNTKKIFTEDGEAVVPDEEEDEETSGINMEAATERLRKEDQEFDKIEYHRKIKEKHREKRLKEKAARRKVNKQHKEVRADEEFDPRTLPDLDKVCNSESSEEEEGDSSDRGGRKRSFSSDSSEDDDSDDEVQQTQVGSKKPRKESTVTPLDTESLVLRLLPLIEHKSIFLNCLVVCIKLAHVRWGIGLGLYIATV